VQVRYRREGDTGRAGAKVRSPPDLAVYGRDAEWRVFAAVTAVDKRAEIVAGEDRGPLLAGPRPL